MKSNFQTGAIAGEATEVQHLLLDIVPIRLGGTGGHREIRAMISSTAALVRVKTDISSFETNSQLGALSVDIYQIDIYPIGTIPTENLVAEDLLLIESFSIGNGGTGTTDIQIRLINFSGYRRLKPIAISKSRPPMTDLLSPPFYADSF